MMSQAGKNKQSGRKRIREEDDLCRKTQSCGEFLSPVCRRGPGNEQRHFKDNVGWRLQPVMS